MLKNVQQLALRGIILPDLPIEESDAYFAACKTYQIDPILMVTPVTSKERLCQIGKLAKGFLYCQARLGTTGKHTKFDQESIDYIKRCRDSTSVPIAMGFGISERADVDFLKGKVDLAICCTAAMKILEEKGPQAMGEFLSGLRK